MIDSVNVALKRIDAATRKRQSVAGERRRVGNERDRDLW